MYLFLALIREMAHIVDMQTTLNEIELTPVSLSLFLWYAKDACNWSGNPFLNGNRDFTKADRGNLTQLKAGGYLTTERAEHDDSFIVFSEKGKALAMRHGIEID